MHLGLYHYSILVSQFLRQLCLFCFCSFIIFQCLPSAANLKDPIDRIEVEQAFFRSKIHLFLLQLS